MATTPRGTAANGTEAAGRVADVLLAFLDGPTVHGVTALARELDLSKAVVHRILRTLVERGLVVPGRPAAATGSGPPPARSAPARCASRTCAPSPCPVLRRLQAATGETTTVSALVPGARVYLDQVVGRSEISMTVEVGRRFPLHAGSSSAVDPGLPAGGGARGRRRRPLERLTA